MAFLKKIFIINILLISFSYAKNKNSNINNILLPIDLVADKGSYDQISGVAVYEGNVKLTQGINKIFADNLIVTLKNNIIDNIKATGKPVKFEYLKKENPIYSKSKKLIYNIKKSTLELIKDVSIKQNGNTILGDKLTYDMKKGIISGYKIKMRFTIN